MEKIKIGLVGCGGMGLGAHTQSYLKDERVEITAFCDILEDRAVKGRDNFFPGAKVYTDFRQLIADKDVDAVDICTPNYWHSRIAVAALEAGKDVFCEKPDAVSPEEALKMKAAAEKSGKLLMVMRNNRFAAASQYAKSFIERGEAGDIYAGRCGWIRRRGIPGKGGWFTTKELSGGGPLIDLGVHMIDLAVWLMGNPTPVAVSGAAFCKFADTETSDSEHAKFGDKKDGGIFDVEDLAMGFIRFDNGACLQIEFSWASNIESESNFVELRGSKAGFTWKNGSLKIFSEDNGVLTDLSPVFKDSSGHQSNLRHFIDVLTGVTAEPVFKPQQGVDMIKILNAIYKSAESGREIVI